MKAKLLIFMLVLAALVATYFIPQRVNEQPIELQKTETQKREPFKSKEECYKAVEIYTENCLKNGGSQIGCLVEQYCDERGCC